MYLMCITGGHYGKNVQKEIKSISHNKKMICSDIYERFLNGSVGLCCGYDMGWFKLGNVLEEDPQEIYNNDKFNFYRTMMEEGKICYLERCNRCSIIL